MWVSGVCFLVDWTDVHGTGRTQVSNCNIQQPYGLYTIEPASPTSLESIRLVTLRIKLDTNVSDGEWAHEAGGGGEWLFIVCLFCFSDFASDQFCCMEVCDFVLFMKKDLKSMV